MRRPGTALLAAMTAGLAALIAAIAVAVIGGEVWRRTNGRMRTRGARGGPASRPRRPGPRSPQCSRQRRRHGGPAPAAVRPGQRQSRARARRLYRSGPGSTAGWQPRSRGAGDDRRGGRSGDATGRCRCRARPDWQRARAAARRAGDAGAVLLGILRPVPGHPADPGRCRGHDQGVAHIEIDAESRLDLVRQLNVLRTPTVLVLAADGRIVRRASGQPRKPDVIAAIGAAAGV